LGGGLQEQQHTHSLFTPDVMIQAIMYGNAASKTIHRLLWGYPSGWGGEPQVPSLLSQLMASPSKFSLGKAWQSHDTSRALPADAC